MTANTANTANTATVFEIDAFTKRQIDALTSIYEASADARFIPKMNDANRAAVLKEMGVTPRMFEKLFDMRALKWARTDNGTVACLVAKAARMLDKAEGDAPAPAPAAVKQTIEAPAAEADADAVSKMTRRECSNFILTHTDKYATKTALRREVRSVAKLRDMVREIMRSDKPAAKTAKTAKAVKPAAKAVAQPAVEQTIEAPVASRKTRALRAKIDSQLSELEKLIADAEAEGVELTGRDIRRLFIAKML